MARVGVARDTDSQPIATFAGSRAVDPLDATRAHWTRHCQVICTAELRLLDVPHGPCGSRNHA